MEKGRRVDIYRVFKEADEDYRSIMRRCGRFNKEMMEDETRPEVEICRTCALAYRQAIAAHKLVKDDDGTLLFFSKENNSNGSIGTVDITYPSSPLFLIYNPDTQGNDESDFYYREWKMDKTLRSSCVERILPTATYGGDMPVEESGNMLILAAAIATLEGNAAYASQHWEVLTTWS